MGEASTENKENNVSKYDKVSMDSTTRKFFPIPLLLLVG